MDPNGFLQLSPSKPTYPPFQFLSIPDQDGKPKMFLEIKERDTSNQFLSLDVESEDVPDDDTREVFRRNERQMRRVDHSKVNEIIAQYQKSEKGRTDDIQRDIDIKPVAEASIQTLFVANDVAEEKVILPIEKSQTNTSVQTEEAVETRRFKEIKDPFHEVTWISRANELKLQGYRSLILNDNIGLLQMGDKRLASLSFQL